MKVIIIILVVLLGCTIAAYQGVKPLAAWKDTLTSNVKSLAQSNKESPKSTPTPTKTILIDNWQIQLISSSWKVSTLNVSLKITNTGPRRNFGSVSLFDPGPELAVIDSTGKRIDPWVPEPNYSKGELMTVPSYTKEYYPDESWTGNLKFEMSPYSGETKLYIGRYSWTQTVYLFSLGSPSK